VYKSYGSFDCGLGIADFGLKRLRLLQHAGAHGSKNDECRKIVNIRSKIVNLTMIKFYKNQELSQKLNIKLSRWKRWSREFLPPDPLGGLQSGYARQYNSDQAFTVFLGGYLVAELKFAIPEARRILHDWHDWLVAHKFYSDYSGSAPSTTENSVNVQYYQIAICRTADANTGDTGFFYFIQTVIADEGINAHGNRIHQKRFVQSSVNSGENTVALNDVASYRVLNISLLRNEFLNSLNGPKAAT